MEFGTGEPRKCIENRELSRSAAAAVRLVTGNAGDHKLVYSLLRAANRVPSADEFQSSLEEPTYEPPDRLLVKHENQLVAHVQVLHRTAWFHGVRAPIGCVAGLAVLPELKEFDYERLLLAAAEQALRNRHAALAIARTDRPAIFQRAGWQDVQGQRQTEANVHEILAVLAARAPRRLPGTHRRSLHIRHWRHVELDAIRQVDSRVAHWRWGTLDRTEAHWRWLVGRRAHDELIVAIHGRDDWNSLHSPPNIVGYAIKRGSHVVELASLPAHRDAAHALLSRACQDAIEHDHRALTLHAPAIDPLHDVLLAAGGNSMSDGTHARTLMLKLLDSPRWLETIYPLLVRRASANGLPLSIELGFEIESKGYRLTLSSDSLRFVHDRPRTPDAVCSANLFGALAVGNASIDTARERGELVANDETAAVLRALFPQECFWQSHVDALQF